MIRLTFFLGLAVWLVGCTAPVSTLSRPDAYYESLGTNETGGSLFSGDAETLSDDAIQKILAFQYEPPPLSRIALMPFGREIWSSWSEELALASENLEAKVLDELRASPKVYDASYLPSILVPQNRTVPHLREAAASKPFFSIRELASSHLRRSRRDRMTLLKTLPTQTSGKRGSGPNWMRRQPRWAT